MASAVLLERHPLDRTVRCRTVANVLSIGFDVRRCFPVLGREVIEGEQRFAVLAEALDRLVVLDAIAFDEAIECSLGIRPGRRHPDALQGTLGLCLQALWQFVQDIRRLVYPAALPARLRPYLIDRLPEAERPVGDSELRGDRQAVPLEIEQQLLPGLRALADAVGKPNEFLLAFGGGADDYQQTLRVIFEPGLDVDAIGPDVDIALGGQVASEPAGVLVDPGRFRRAMLEADSPPASWPSNAANASPKSPVRRGKEWIRISLRGLLRPAPHRVSDGSLQD